MFTGLIQGLGRVTLIEQRSHEKYLHIVPYFALSSLTIGESIAVNGVCLTVEARKEGLKGWFKIYASAETLRATSLGQLLTGDLVNLERALTLNDRIGGHLVSGHVDCIATVAAISSIGKSLDLRIKFPPEFQAQIVAKGSVALDGISLTVNRCENSYFTTNIILATKTKTTISTWQPDRQVNMETDLIGKYVQQILKTWNSQKCAKKQNLSMSFLAEHGFM